MLMVFFLICQNTQNTRFIILRSNVLNITEIILILVSSIASNETGPSLTSLWLQSGSFYVSGNMWGGLNIWVLFSGCSLSHFQLDFFESKWKTSFAANKPEFISTFFLLCLETWNVCSPQEPEALLVNKLFVISWIIVVFWSYFLLPEWHQLWSTASAQDSLIWLLATWSCKK